MREVLVDTHVALWLMTNSEQCPNWLRKAAKETGITWIFHQVSLWELQIKFDLGKIKLPGPPADYLPPAIAKTGFVSREIENEGIDMLCKLPHIHRDPFDRLLIAHALVNGWEIATVDEKIKEYPVRILKTMD